MPSERQSSADSSRGAGREALALAQNAIGATLVLVALATVAVLAIDPLRDAVGNAIQGDTGALRVEINDLGIGGVAILYALVLIHTFVWYPAEIIDAAAGYVYGFWGGVVLIHAGWIVQGVIAWLFGREAARPLVLRLAGEERFMALERLVERGGVVFLLGMRLIPIVPFSLFSYVAGATRVPLGRFLWTTAVGYLPLTALFVYLGSQLETLSATDPVLLGGAVLLLAAMVLMRPVSRMLTRPGGASKEPEGGA